MASEDEKRFNSDIMNNNWIKELQTKEFPAGKSQFGESAIIDYIFEHIPPANRFFVDLGAGFYGHGAYPHPTHKPAKGIPACP